jgi:glycosyltransferase involved in cell wall biosynthesis
MWRNHVTRKDEQAPADGRLALRIGIAIPSYRAADTLEATLRSCISQTHTNWVAFVMVDGKDATDEEAIVSALSDPRIQLECNGRQVGQFGNFNRAILRCYAAGAQWVKLLCADDVLHPDALERMLVIASRSSDCAFVYGHYNGIDERGKLLWEVDLSGAYSGVMPGREFLIKSFSRALLNPFGGPSSVMIRADTIERCGLFSEQMSCVGDAEYWHRILPTCDVGIVGEAPILDYRFHQNSVTGRQWLTIDRIPQLIDIARAVAARYPPFSREWLLAQRMAGELIATNLLTVLGLIRQGGRTKLALQATFVTLRRLTIYSALSAVRHFIAKIGRIALGLPRQRVTELSPAVKTRR